MGENLFNLKNEVNTEFIQKFEIELFLIFFWIVFSDISIG